MVDFKDANKIFKGKYCMWGNFSFISIMLDRSRKDVKRAVLSCIDDGNENTFIAAVCEIPKMTPLENMIQVDSTLKETGSRR